MATTATAAALTLRWRDAAARWLIERQHRANEARRPAPGAPPDPAWWGAAVSPAGRLQVGGCDVSALAAAFGTPLLVVDRARLQADYRRFRAAFAALHPRVLIAYSYKTNPLPAVLSVLHGQGALAEVISHYELWLALKLGVPPEHIVFNGPGKGSEAIGLAVSQGVGRLHLDGLDEIGIVAAAARAAGRRQPVGLRVTGTVGWTGQFGLAMHDGSAFEAFRRLAAEPALQPCGLHVHMGSGLHDPLPYLKLAGEVMDFAATLRAQLGVKVDCFDFGGGFGVPTVRPFDRWDQRLMRHGHPPAPIDPEAAPGPADFAAALVATLRAAGPAGEGAPPTLLLEPGRAITSSAQSLVLRVLTIKHAQAARACVILDGGSNLAGPTAYESHELLAVGAPAQPPTRRYDFFGPLCHPGERLFVARPFPALQAGDLVAVMDAGAYFVPNQTTFSQPRPAVVMVADGAATLIRQRESFDDLARLDRFH